MIAIPIAGLFLIVIVLYILIWSRSSSNQHRLDRFEDWRREQERRGRKDS